MFWTSASANSLDKIGLDFHVPNQRYQAETQKDKVESLFFYKKETIGNIFVLIVSFNSDKKLLWKPLKEYYFHHIRIEFDTWEW